jgi:hypothetical protein
MKLTLIAALTTASAIAISKTPAQAQLWMTPSPAVQQSPIQVTYPLNTSDYGCCEGITMPQAKPTWEPGNAPMTTPAMPTVESLPPVLQPGYQMPASPYIQQDTYLPDDWYLPHPELPTHSGYWKN